MAEDAVSTKLLSPLNSLKQGKTTGNVSDCGRIAQ
jgi:hypothetical protein